jgi:hypothetical protein
MALQAISIRPPTRQAAKVLTARRGKRRSQAVNTFLTLFSSICVGLSARSQRNDM